MTIVTDTNVLIAMLIKSGIVRKVIVNNPGKFIAPDWNYLELWEHRDVWNRADLGDEELFDLVQEIRRYYVLEVPKEAYIDFVEESSGYIADKDDVPTLALALAVDNEGIWTFNTKHFRTEIVQKHVNILSTRDVVDLYRPME